MREILFRGKRVKDGKWIEGYYVRMLNPYSKSGVPVQHCICDGTPFIQEIDHDTVCQYIGLNDVSGRKIFEGDIVQPCDSEAKVYEGSLPSIVEYDNYNCPCCDGVYGWSYVGGYADIRDDDYVIVVGNIYDNPEYLRKED